MSEHLPDIAKRSDGDWGVFCRACSAEAQDYVFPCKVRPDIFPSVPVLRERPA